MTTGARKGEILGLKWKDIDFKRNIATFRDTKNGEVCSVHLSEQILNCLKDEFGKRVIKSQYVFPNNDGTKPEDIRTAWELSVKEANLQGICFYSLRDTSDSHLCMDCFSTLEKAPILGRKRQTSNQNTLEK